MAMHHPMSHQLPVATGLTATKGLELLTWGTPNAAAGFKTSIMLEELKEAYGMDYTLLPIALSKGAHKQPWVLKLNPAARIPILVDHDQGDLAICESSAILRYVVTHYDPEHKFSFTSVADQAHTDQWLAFMQGDLTPLGAYNIRFNRFLPQKHAFPMQMFHREGCKTFDTLNAALEGRDYLVGEGRGRISVVDLGCFSYVNNSRVLGLGALDRWPNLKAWQQRLWARPAVQKGVNTPYPAMMTNEIFEKKMAEDPEFKAQEEKLAETTKQAMYEFPPIQPGPPPAK